MNERHFARRIAETLNYGLTRVEQDKLARLRAARQQALLAAEKPRHVFGLQWLGTLSTGHGHMRSAHRWAPAVLLVLVLVAGFGTWQYRQQHHAEVEEIDAALLSGDLPIHAYIDNGFDAWLEHSPQR